jgi:hypothetical protein
MSRREAACSCGQLRLRVDEEPIRVSVCHCLACQRRTGSAFGLQARFAREHVRVTGRSREFVRLSDEGERRTYSFCPECGTTVSYQLSSDPGLTLIPVGTFADPAFPPPVRSVWESRKHPWVSLPAAVEHYD